MRIQEVAGTIKSDVNGHPELFLTKLLNGHNNLTGYENFDW